MNPDTPTPTEEPLVVAVLDFKPKRRTIDGTLTFNGVNTGTALAALRRFVDDLAATYTPDA